MKKLLGTSIHKTLKISSNIEQEVNGEKTYTVCKQQEENPNLTWFYASVEDPKGDSAGDVVRIDGISWSDYHNANTSLKILAQHERFSANTLEDSIVGIAQHIVRTTSMVSGVKVPCLAIGFKWAEEYREESLFQANGLPQVNDDGTQKTVKVLKLTPLAAKYKGRWEAGTLDAMSVGLLVDDYEQIKDAGLDYTQTRLIESSIVTLPANPLAVSLQQELFDLEGKLEKKIEDTNKAAELLTALKDLSSKMDERIEKISENLNSRLDIIEASLVTSSKTTSSQKSDLKKEEVASQLTEITDILNKFAKR